MRLRRGAKLSPSETNKAPAPGREIAPDAAAGRGTRDTSSGAARHLPLKGKANGGLSFNTADPQGEGFFRLRAAPFFSSALFGGAGQARQGQE